MKTFSAGALFLAIFCSAFVQAALAQNRLSQPIEIGLVRWETDFSKAILLSKEQNKAVFALFQEVPGCSGTKEFGRDVLSHPLLVEAIESEFIPTVIYNNQPGKHADLLKRFSEPSWNYQVIRFFDSNEKDIIPRKDRVWSTSALAQRMAAVLKLKGKKVPAYLKSLGIDYRAKQVKHAAFAMYCYWTGEMELGAIDGVLSTEAGHYENREVTRVWYDSRVLSLEELVRRAAQVKCADKLYLKRQELSGFDKVKSTRLNTGVFDIKNYKRAGDSNQKKQIQNSRYHDLGLTPYQLTKINAFARRDKSKALSYLSPRQRRKFESLSRP